MRSARLGVVAVLLSLLAVSAMPQAAHAAGLPTKKVWLHDVAVVMKPAVPYLDRRVAEGGGPMAIVLDIDNTSLASHYSWPHPVRKTLAFAREAHALGVTVFFVTGRLSRDAQRQGPTLRAAGYTVDGICGRKKGEGLAQSKTRCRRAIVGRGFTIIASVGNLPSDFRGGLYERKFDLPDYGRRLS